MQYGRKRRHSESHCIRRAGKLQGRLGSLMDLPTGSISAVHLEVQKRKAAVPRILFILYSRGRI